MKNSIDLNWDNYSELIDAIARRRCVIVVGSGVSMHSKNKEGHHPPSWDGFLRGCIGNFNEEQVKFIEDLLKKLDYLTACEFIKDTIKEDKFERIIEDSFKGYQHAEIHRYIFQLDSSIVISPNFDEIYDTYARTESQNSVIIKTFEDDDIAKYLQGGEHRLIIKTHGTINNPKNLIFTRSEYAKARIKSSLLYDILKSLAITHTFLFIGCGINDPDIRMILEDLVNMHSRMPKHFMLIKKDSILNEMKDIIERTMSLTFVEYDKGENNDHSQLVIDLKNLVDSVEDERLALKESLLW